MLEVMSVIVNIVMHCVQLLCVLQLQILVK